MIGSFRVLLPALCLFLLGADSSGVSTAPIHVVKKPAIIERKTFDPHHLPTPAPPLAEGETAICVTSSNCNASFESETLYRKRVAGGFEAAVAVTSVNVVLHLTITIWTPTDAPGWLKEHEEGHRQISEKVYSGAEKAGIAAARAIAGHTFVATAPTAAAAEKAALTKAQQTLIDEYSAGAPAVWKRVNEIYDDITGHGLNSAPNRRHPVAVPTAIEEAFKQYAEETAPHTQPAP